MIGYFQWGGADFSRTAENVEFRIEGGDAVPVLHATLRCSDGSTRVADINLAERIENINGGFQFSKFLLY